jgi:hypothetical protein
MFRNIRKSNLLGFIELLKNYLIFYIYWIILLILLISLNSQENKQLSYEVLINFLYLKSHNLFLISFKFIYYIFNGENFLFNIYNYILNYFKYNYIYYYIEIDYIIWLLNKKNKELLFYEPIHNINFDILLWIF